MRMCPLLRPTDTTLLTLFWVQAAHTRQEVHRSLPQWSQTRITSTCCICRDVRGEGPQQDASASPGPLGSFLSTLHAYYICAATGRCSRPQPPGAVFPQCQSLRVIPLSVPPSCGKIHSYEPEPFVGPSSVRLWSFLLTCIIYHGLPRRIPRRGP